MYLDKGKVWKSYTLWSHYQVQVNDAVSKTDWRLFFLLYSDGWIDVPSVYRGCSTQHHLHPATYIGCSSIHFSNGAFRWAGSFAHLSHAFPSSCRLHITSGDLLPTNDVMTPHPLFYWLTIGCRWWETRNVLRKLIPEIGSARARLCLLYMAIIHIMHIPLPPTAAVLLCCETCQFPSPFISHTAQYNSKWAEPF